MGLRTDSAHKDVEWLVESRCQLEELLHRLGFSWEEASDAAQEAILEAWKIMEGKAEDTIFDRSAWLRQVAINKARQHCRSRWGKCVPLDAERLAIDPFAEKEEPNFFAAVHSAIEQLTPDLRDLVVYCYLDDHTYSEAVERFHVSLGIVSRKLREARDLLRSELNKLPEFARAPNH